MKLILVSFDDASVAALMSQDCRYKDTLSKGGELLGYIATSW